MKIGGYGTGGYGTSPYGGAFSPFGVAYAVALSSTSVRVVFNDMFDDADLATIDPANYSIDHFLTVSLVVIESANAVVLTTSEQDQISYVVTVNNVFGYARQEIAPDLHQAEFDGFEGLPTFQAVAVSATKVRLVFTKLMLQNFSFLDPASYTVEDMSGNSFTIDLVEPEPNGAPFAVALTVSGGTFESGILYRAVIGPGIVTSDGLSPVPDASVFQWFGGTRFFTVPVELFTGEVQGGLFGTPDGLVFFSPALTTSAPNSIIQLDEVSVCTRAFDEYHWPSPPDPPALFIYDGQANPSLLGSTSLWAPWPILSEIQVNTTDRQEDELPPTRDSRAIATLREPWDHNFVALLNDSYWHLFDGTPTNFICADNQFPIPPGPTVVIPLQNDWVVFADSVVTADLTLTMPVAATIVADSTTDGDATVVPAPTADMLADSTMDGDMSLIQAVDAAILADSTTTGALHSIINISAAIVADSAISGGTFHVGLQGYWPADNSSQDASGHARHMVPRITPTAYAAGKFDQAFDISGGPSGVRRPVDDTAFNLVGDFTVQSWLNLRTINVTENDFVSKYDSGSNGWTFIVKPNTIFWFSSPSGLNVQYAQVVTPLTWHHIVARRTGLLFEVFFDGVAIGSSAISAAGWPAGPFLALGGRTDFGGAFPINGLQDDTAIWSRALSDAEVAWLWNGGVGHRISDATPLVLLP